jgi:hypothetical protein
MSDSSQYQSTQGDSGNSEHLNKEQQQTPMNGFCSDGPITVKTDPINSTTADLEIKLFHFSKALHFLVEIRNVGEIRSVTFSTHNSGKQR